MATQEKAALPRGSPAGTNPAGVRASLQRARPHAVTRQLSADELSGGGFHSDCGQCALVGQTDELQMDLRMYP